MIDREARDRLATLLDQVVAGTISHERFAFEADDIAHESQDKILGAFGALADSYYPQWGVMSDIRFFDRRSQLAYAAQRRISIAKLFLNSNFDYEWPDWSQPKWMAWDGLLLLGCGIGVCIGLMTFPLSVLSGWFHLVSAICFTIAILSWRTSRRWAKLVQARYEADRQSQGDYDVWPFIRRADFEKAAQLVEA